MLREFFLNEVKKAVSAAAERGALGQMKSSDSFTLAAEIPKNPLFGDFAVNVSSLSKFTKLPPAKTAELAAAEINTADFDVNVTAGFINFKLHTSMLNKILEEVLEKKLDYGGNNLGAGEKIILEYVSANPTGPFHIGHGRWAAAGSALANIMKFSGYDVFQEFYINDAGSQIQKLGRSLYIRILQQQGIKIDFPEDEEAAKEFYTGEFLIPAAEEFIKEYPDKAAEIKELYGKFKAALPVTTPPCGHPSEGGEVNPRPCGYPSEGGEVNPCQCGHPSEEGETSSSTCGHLSGGMSADADKEGFYNYKYLQFAAEYARLKMLSNQQKLLKNFRTYFDNFYSELTLHQSGKVKDCIEKLQKAGVLYEKDGALWFASSKYGDEKDRVIKKSDGAYTYLTADIAYHYDKLQRGFSKLINIWGADHHGYIARMRAAIEVLGYNPDCLEILLGQLVNLVINGEEVRMGKRTKMITLDDLIEEAGVDAVRYWMIMKSIDTALDFDVELAKSKSDDNPVFYVQYAHARACSILRTAASDKPDIINKIIKKGSEIDLSKADFSVLWASNDGKSEETAKKLILKLEEYKYTVQNAAKNRTPYLITKYLQELASDFHKFYNFSRVLADDERLMTARLGIVQAVIYVLKSALNLIAVNAPEKM